MSGVQNKWRRTCRRRASTDRKVKSSTFFACLPTWISWKVSLFVCLLIGLWSDGASGLPPKWSKMDSSRKHHSGVSCCSTPEASWSWKWLSRWRLYDSMAGSIPPLKDYLWSKSSVLLSFHGLEWPQGTLGLFGRCALLGKPLVSSLRLPRGQSKPAIWS